MALIEIQDISCNTHLGIWKKEEELHLLESVFELNDIEKEEYKNITNEARKKEWLTIRVLLTEMLQSRITISHNENRKPYIKNLDINISISHSKHFVTILTSTTDYVGIDVENISERIGKVKHKFLSPEELAWCDNLELQTACWSAKESIFKIYEKDLDFHDMVVSPFEIIGQEGKFKTDVRKKDKEGSYVIHFQKIENDIITYTLSKSALF